MGRQPKRAVIFAIAAVVAVTAGALGAALVRQSNATSTPSPAPTVASTTSSAGPSVASVATSTATPQLPVIGGSWTKPADKAKAATSSLKLAATPTADPSDVAIARVRFTIGWKGAAAKTACTATKPAGGAEWSCTADLVRLGAPAGTLTLGFDVVDDAGDVTNSPDGTRTVGYAGPPAARWSKPTVVDGAGCASMDSLVAVIDGDGGYQIATGCYGVVAYSVLVDDAWHTTRFKPPASRQEYGPQLAFQSDVLYMAYTRVAVEEGGCGDRGLRDVGVYYRTRTLPTGDWSDPTRIGEISDRLHAFRVVDGGIHATVLNADDGHLYYETVKGSSYHRYAIPKATGMTSLRIGDDGNARIAYEAGDSLRYATFTGSGFSSKKIPGTNGGYGPVLVLGANDQPHLVWFHGQKPGGGCAEPEDPKDGTYYSTEKGGTWRSERLTARRDFGSLTVDTDSGRVHAVISGKAGRLVYLTKVGSGSWSKRTLDSRAWPAVIRLDQETGALLVAYGRHENDGQDVFVDRVYVVTRH